MAKTVSRKGIKPIGEAITAGWQKVEIEKFVAGEWDRDSASWYVGMPIWELQYNILHDLQGDTEYKGEKLFDRFSLDREQKSFRFTCKFCDDLGIAEEFDPDQVAEDFFGVEIWVYVARKKLSADQAASLGRKYDNSITSWSTDEPIDTDAKNGVRGKSTSTSKKKKTTARRRPRA